MESFYVTLVCNLNLPGNIQSLFVNKVWSVNGLHINDSNVTVKMSVLVVVYTWSSAPKTSDANDSKKPKF